VLGVELRLASVPEGVRAGHYVLLSDPAPGADAAPVPFSLASAPRELPRLTLHYRPTPGSEDASRADALFVAGRDIAVDLPHGECAVERPLPRPLLILAGGTGIAQARSIVREHGRDPGATLRLVWGARTPEELYLAGEFDAAAGAGFQWIGACEAGATADRRRGRVADVVAEEVAAGRLALGDWDVLVAGGPPMVWGTVAALRPHGLRRERTRSDVFAYAPRDDLWSD
jgi:CDP-4-dehydro-6-deoxyglucose reductase